METLTQNNNGNSNVNGNNSQRPHPTKSRNFSQVAVNKSDVGDFQAGYFVMADMPYQPKPKNNNNNKTLERHNSEKRAPRPTTHQPHQRARSTNDLDTQTREGEINVSYGRLPTSPHRSPTRNNKRNSHSPPQPSQTPQSTYMDSNNLPLSPHKPRKAPHERHVDRDRESVSPHVESGSPPKDKGPSPTPNRWAGPAFSNAPPPSSLPLPDFPPFSLSSSVSSPSISSPTLSSSPPAPTTLPISIPSQTSASSSTTTSSNITPFFLQVPQQHYKQEPFFVQPMYPAPFPHYNAHFSFAEATPAHGYHPSLAQLSTDLRRMLNITSDPVVA